MIWKRNLETIKINCKICRSCFFSPPRALHHTNWENSTTIWLHQVSETPATTHVAWFQLFVVSPKTCFFLTTTYRKRHPFVQVVIPPNHHLLELILKMFRYPTPAFIPSNQPSPERATQSNPLRGPNWKCRHSAPAKDCIIWQVLRTALIHLIVYNVNIKSCDVTIFFFRSCMNMHQPPLGGCTICIDERN